MAAGLNHLFVVDPGMGTKLVLIAVVSVIATASAVSGVGNGIRILPGWNIRLSNVLPGTFVVVGPFQC